MLGFKALHDMITPVAVELAGHYVGTAPAASSPGRDQRQYGSAGLHLSKV